MLRVILVFLTLAVVALLICVTVLATLPKPPAAVTEPTEYCTYKDSDYVKPRNFDDPEPLDDLTPDEYQAVYDFMMTSSEIPGLTPIESATVNSSYILVIDLQLPKKSEVIDYLDHGKEKPERKALVIVIHGNTDPRKVQEYIVSPLPNPTSVSPYQNPSYRRYPVPYTARFMDAVDYKPFYKIVVTNAMEKLYPLLMASYGRGYHNCTGKDDCIIVFDTAPRGTQSGDRRSWVWTFGSTDGYYNQPLGLEMLVEHKSSDISEWKVELVVYNGQAFDSVDSLMQAYDRKSLKLINLKNLNTKFTSYDVRGTPPERPLQGPRLFEPDGKRYSVNGQHVTYGKWSFHYHMRPSTGLQLFDVKFDGTRIAYEISLQEVVVFYTGYGATQSNTNYYDVSWFLGATEMELMRGIDCPESAVFLDTYFLLNTGKAQRYKNNVCIFENNGAIPLRRHYENDYKTGYDFHGGITDYHLVIRTVANVWNYDYVFDHIFYANGGIEVKASATGYLQATYRLPEEEKYGGKVYDYVMGDLHTHVFNYKVDLDIAGEKNRYSEVDISLETVKSPWIKNYDRTKMKMTNHLIERETKTQTFKNGAIQYLLMYNNNATNKFGSKRAYRILNKAPNPFLEFDISTSKAASWAKYPVIVTKRKDEEQSSTSIYAQHDPWNPVLDFDDFIDGESIVDEDLVVWVTTGTHHIPGTEDIPSTPTTWNQYSFFLTPHNYFTECPSIYSPDTVIARPPKNGETKPDINTYGKPYESKCTPQKAGPENYDGFRR